MPRPRLTFLHGFMGHSSDWDEVRASLPGFETDAIDVTVAGDWQTGIQQLGETIAPDSVLIGYSMGARLALGVALEFPRQFAGLVFASGNPGLESDEDRQQRWQSDCSLAEQLETESIELFLQNWYRAEVFAAVPEEIREAEIARKLNHSSCDWPAIMKANSVSRQPNYWPRLTELKMPTVVVAGELDEKYRSIAFRMKAQRGTSDLETQIIRDSGHIVHRERPDAFVQLLQDFLKRTDSS